MNTSTITYAVGDLVNGDYATVATYDEALEIYTADAKNGAKSEFEDWPDIPGKEDWSFEDFLSKSLEFHYIVKITTTETVDEDGEKEAEESREIVDGGTLDLNAN